MRLLLLALFSSLSTGALAQNPADAQIPLIFTGGHETEVQDHGRPVILIAAALNVPPQVFRDAFSHVHPAGAGQEPEPDQVRKNKEALMSALGPYGVTDDRLNEVSNYYRYNRSRGEMWKSSPATGYATVRNGEVISLTITDPGSGYSSPPTGSLQGMLDIHPTATLAFGTDFSKNGSIKAISP